eukprot:241941-Amphidinium_carterae.1
MASKAYGGLWVCFWSSTEQTDDLGDKASPNPLPWASGSSAKNISCTDFISGRSACGSMRMEADH